MVKILLYDFSYCNYLSSYISDEVGFLKSEQFLVNVFKITYVINWEDFFLF